MTLRSVVVAVIPLVGWLPAAPAAAQAPVTAFVNVSVIPMDREQVLPDQTVIVQGDRIMALGPTTRVAIPAGVVRVNGKRHFLMPGLADMHVHLGSPMKFRPTDPSLMAVLLFTLVANGVTAVRDMHSGIPWTGDTADAWMPTLRRRVAAGEILAPKIYAAGDPDISSPAGAVKSIVALKAAGYDFVKNYEYEPPIYDSIVAAARRVGLPVVGHASDRPGGLLDVFNDHWASLEHMTGYFSHVIGGVAFPEKLVDSLGSVPDAALRRMALETKRAGVWNCPTLAVRQFIHEPELLRRHLTDSRMVKALQDAGAGLLLGTDANAFSGHLLWSGFAIHRELEAMVKVGLTPYQALTAGTRNAARFLGMEDSTGTVAVGKRADLVLLKANPLVDISNTAALAGVMIGGRWLSRGDLDRHIDTMQVVSSDPKRTDRFGTLAAQMRVLKNIIWR